jgi:hypothetical protein
VWVAVGSTVNVSFHGTGSDQPRSSDIFLTSYDEVEGYFVFVWYLQGRIIGESDSSDGIEPVVPSFVV